MQATVDPKTGRMTVVVEKDEQLEAGRGRHYIICANDDCDTFFAARREVVTGICPSCVAKANAARKVERKEKLKEAREKAAKEAEAAKKESSEAAAKIVNKGTVPKGQR